MRKLLFILLLTQLNFVYGQENQARIYLKSGASLINFRQNNKGASGNFRAGYNFGLNYDFEYKNGRRFARSGEILFIHKGGYNAVSIPIYNSSGQPEGIGSETFPIKLNYLSVSAGITFKASENIYFRIAPRLDYLLSFKSIPYYYQDARTKKDFYAFTGGVSYSIGFLKFTKASGLFFELQGQNDFFKSGDKKSIGRFYNNYYGINIGYHIAFDREKKDG